MQADNFFDVIIFGTGLTESMVAAALAKAGFKLAHIDENPFYGADEASLSADDLIKWTHERSGDLNVPETTSGYLASQRARFTSISCSSSTVPHARQYSLSLCPSVIPSIGAFTSSLISSGVAKYGGFRLLERVGIYDSSGFAKIVPANKEDVFNNKEMPLVEKRRLMGFLMFAAGDFEESRELEGKEALPISDFLRDTFSLTGEIASAITFSLAYCTSASEPTLPVIRRIRRYLRSAGRYGASPFLVGHYGGSGEIAQGFCRTSAVHGSTYVLGQRITGIVPSEPSEDEPGEYSVQIEGFPEALKCTMIISSADYIPENLRSLVNFVPPNTTQFPSSVARGIAIVDQPIRLGRRDSDPPPESSQDAAEPDTSVLIFPPSTTRDGSSTTSVSAFITGWGTISAPQGKWIVHLLMTLTDTPQSSAESLLRPYLDAVLSLTPSASPPQPLFTAFYIQHPTATPKETPNGSIPWLVTPSPAYILTEACDSAAENAEAVFWKAVPLLQRRRHATTSGETIDKIETFWPTASQGDGEEDVDGDW